VRAVEAGRIHFGRYGAPIADPNLRARAPFGRFRLKEWHYTSLVTERFFFAFAVVQLGYVANAFCYLVDRADATKLHGFEALSPLGIGLSFAESSVAGTTRWQHRRQLLEIAWRNGAWQVTVDVQLQGERLHGAFAFAPAEALALLHPLAPGRPAYTHKEAACPATGSLTWRGESLAADGLATIDWTRSLALRETSWKWASFAAMVGGRRVGLNLSAEVYDDASGQSRENAVWLDGKVFVLGGVRFSVPPEPSAEPWTLRSMHDDAVDLRFQPLGARAQSLDLWLLRSRFVQPYGTFTGTVRPSPDLPALNVDGAFGVVEDHQSRW